MDDIRPKKRTKLRISLGKCYYTFRRYLNWYFDGKKYSSSRQNRLLPYVIVTHKTPLIRHLKNVDMWLQYNKIRNLEIASAKVNNIILKPSETFSYWKLIGNPTKRKGYLKGMVLFYGGFKAATGGGLCQLSNLLYWMTLHTPLTVTERYRHSFDVFPDSNRTQPFGSGATCVYNYRDLQIYNGTDQPYQLKVYLTNDYLVGEWRSIIPSSYKYKVYERDHKITHECWGSYVRHNLIYRKKYDKNMQLISDEYITENHALMMYEPLIGQYKEGEYSNYKEQFYNSN